MVPVEIFQLELTDVTFGFVHLHEFGEGVQHHCCLEFPRMSHTSISAFVTGQFFCSIEMGCEIMYYINDNANHNVAGYNLLASLPVLY